MQKVLRIFSRLLIAGAILTLMPAAISYGVNSDEDAPPSLNLSLPDESDTPPSLNLSLPDESDAPPSLNLDLSSTSAGTMQITDEKAVPKSFNALIDETKISYTLSANAIVEIRIINQNSETVVKLLDNQTVNKGEYFIKWNGTLDNKNNGTPVKAGTYRYRIIAKDPTTTATQDSAEGEITVFAINTAVSGASNNQSPLINSSNLSGASNPVGTSNASASNRPSNGTYLPGLNYGSNSANPYDQATVYLQNSKSGRTAATGPGVLIYGIFPLAGFLFKRKK